MRFIDELPLTPKQQLFCDEYLTDMNASRAALRAGYSAGTALNGQLMQLPKIKAYIANRTKAVSQQLQITHATVLAELGKIAFSNMGNYYGNDGRIKPVDQMTDDEKAAIWQLSVTEGKDGTTIKIKLNNKLSALEKIAKHLQFYNAEAPQAHTEYVYMDKSEVMDDDRFEDRTFGWKRKNQESRVKNQDSEGLVVSSELVSGEGLVVNGEEEVGSEEANGEKAVVSIEAEAAGETETAAVPVAVVVAQPAQPVHVNPYPLQGKRISREDADKLRRERRREAEYWQKLALYQCS